MQRQTSEQLQYLNVILKRLKSDIPSIRNQYVKLRTGIMGERRVDREWKEVKLAGQLLHDFTCVNEFGHSHQIDTIFICKNFILVVEIKNISGRIDFDDRRRQFIRTREDGTIESFMNPVDQVKRHRDFIESIFIDWSDYVPVEAAIIIANPSTVIGRISEEVPIFNVSGLRTKISELVKKYNRNALNVSALRNQLESYYKPLKKWHRLNLDELPLKKGVLCCECKSAMYHSVSGFICYGCGWRDRHHEALREAMYDFSIMYSNEITSRAFREFIGITNPNTAYSCLKRLGLKQKGNTKGRIYIIPNNIWQMKNKI